jgi:hypothetical protein
MAAAATAHAPAAPPSAATHAASAPAASAIAAAASVHAPAAPPSAATHAASAPAASAIAAAATVHAPAAPPSAATHAASAPAASASAARERAPGVHEPATVAHAAAAPWSDAPHPADAGRPPAPPQPKPPPAANDVPPPSAAGPDDSLWARIVRQVKTSQPALGAVLDHGMPLEVTAKTLRIGFPDNSFFGRQAQSASARSSLLRAAEAVLGVTPELHIGSPGDAKLSTLAELEEKGRRVRKAARVEAALKHPSVVSAMEVFEESEGSVDVQVDME